MSDKLLPNSICRAMLSCMLGGLLVSITSCFPNPKCKYDYGVNVHSPNGTHVAVVEDYVCRPWRLKTLSKRAVIVELPVSQLRSAPGEIFEIKGDHQVKAVWLDDVHLLIQCPACDTQMIETRKDTWQGITISYAF